LVLKALLADDHAFTLEGMQHALELGGRIEVCAVAANGIAAIALARLHRPDVAVLDLVLPDADGVEVFTEISRWSPKTRCAIVTGSTDPAALERVLRAGVPGLFTKACPTDEVRDGLLRLAAGQTVRSRRIAGLVKRPNDQPENDRITPRELQVLQGIAEGMTNAAIAENLAISPKTVESHRASLMRKLDSRSTAALLMQAIRLNLLVP